MRYRIRRYQLPIQPGFSVTGQSAQGKTLPKVLCNLGEGTWSNYVAVSRARRREDLFLMRAITLDKLNIPHSNDLLKELARYKPMEHNTMIKYGFKTGTPMPVPDPEDSSFTPSSTIHAGFSASLIWDYTEDDSGTSTCLAQASHEQSPVEAGHSNITGTQEVSEAVATERAPTSPNGLRIPTSGRGAKETAITSQAGESREQSYSNPSVVSERGSTKRKTCAMMPTPVPQRRKTDGFSLQGCTWSSEDWSCAYDTFYMVVACVYRQSDREWKARWRTYGSCAELLALGFDSLNNTGWTSKQVSAINAARDALRETMVAVDSRTFPRHGHHMVSITDLIDVVLHNNHLRLSLTPRARCDGEAIASSRNERNTLLYSVYERPSDTGLPELKRHNHQCWINAACTLDEQYIWRCSHSERCLNISETRFVVKDPPLLFYLRHSGRLAGDVLPVKELFLPYSTNAVKYSLCGIIYAGDRHFTARVVYLGYMYTYDGRGNAGMCIREEEKELASFSIRQMASISSLSGRNAYN